MDAGPGGWAGAGREQANFWGSDGGVEVSNLLGGFGVNTELVNPADGLTDPRTQTETLARLKTSGRPGRGRGIKKQLASNQNKASRRCLSKQLKGWAGLDLSSVTSVMRGRREAPHALGHQVAGIHLRAHVTARRHRAQAGQCPREKGGERERERQAAVGRLVAS